MGKLFGETERAAHVPFAQTRPKTPTMMPEVATRDGVIDIVSE